MVPSGKDVLLVATSQAALLPHHEEAIVSCSPGLHVPIAVRRTSAGSGATPEYLHSELLLLRLRGPLAVYV